jgi:hypothetical protein
MPVRIQESLQVDANPPTAESLAMAAVAVALETLSPAERARVCLWIQKRYQKKKDNDVWTAEDILRQEG